MAVRRRVSCRGRGVWPGVVGVLVLNRGAEGGTRQSTSARAESAGAGGRGARDEERHDVSGASTVGTMTAVVRIRP